MKLNRLQCELAKNFIETNSLPVPESGCWIWEACEDHGRVRFMGQSELLDTLAFEAFMGPIPQGQCVSHRCHVEGCVNPVHLKLLNITVRNTELLDA